MSHIELHTNPEVHQPVVVEGLPGVGLVGKLATDHVISELDMRYVGYLTCPGLPQVVTYDAGDRTLRPPVRLYAEADDDVLALQSDVPVSPSAVSDFAHCLTGWIAEQNALPLYFSGWPTEVGDGRALWGVATGDGGRLLDERSTEPPAEDGIWSGQTGALLNRAQETNLTALGFITEADPQFPDPVAACVLINQAINPIAGVEIDDSALRQHAEEIREEKAQFAHQMGETDGDDSSRAEPLRMFQ
ncbi:proteasome assembly chaperone family protein [Haladaptatus sp. NG-SE-30]